MSNQACLNDSGGAVQPILAQLRQAWPAAPGEGAGDTRVRLMFSVGFTKKLEDATMKELLDSEYPNVSITVSRHQSATGSG